MWALIYLLSLLFLLLIIINGRYILAPLRSVPRKYWIILLVMLIIFGTVYWFFVPNVNRLTDEQVLLQKASDPAARNILDPPMNAVVGGIYRFAFLTFGISNMVAIKCNLVFALIDLALLFILMTIMFDDNKIGTLAAAFVGCTNSYLLSATTSYTQIISLTFLLMSSIFFFLFIKYGKLRLNILFMFTLSILPFTRIELAALIPIYLIFWILMKRNMLNLKNIRYWVKNISIWIVFLAASIPFMLKVYRFKINAYINMPYHTLKTSNIPATFMMLANQLSSSFQHHQIVYSTLILFLLLSSVTVLFLRQRQAVRPLILSLVLILSGSFIIRASIKPREISFLFLFLILFFIIIDIYNALIYSRHNKRLLNIFFLLSVVVSILLTYLSNSYFIFYYYPILSAYGVAIIAIPVGILLKERKYHLDKIVLIALLLVLPACLFVAADDTHSTEQTRAEYYLDTASPNIIEDFIPDNCLILASYDFLLGGGTSLNVTSLEDEYNKSVIVKAGCVYYLEDYYCRNYPFIKVHCDKVGQDFDIEPKLIIFMKEQNINYTLYRINKSASNMPERAPIFIELDKSGKVVGGMT